MLKRYCDWCGEEIAADEDFHIISVGDNIGGTYASFVICEKCYEEDEQIRFVVDKLFENAEDGIMEDLNEG